MKPIKVLNEEARTTDQEADRSFWSRKAITPTLKAILVCSAVILIGFSPLLLTIVAVAASS